MKTRSNMAWIGFAVGSVVVVSLAAFALLKTQPISEREQLSVTSPAGSDDESSVAVNVAPIKDVDATGFKGIHDQAASDRKSSLGWQYEYGFRIPEKYDRLTEAELANLARQGDGHASQLLATKIWDRTGSREEAAAHYLAAIERGSVGAIGELVAMYDPAMTQGLAEHYHSKFGKSLEPDLPSAFIWARTAMYRGDLDATFAIDRLRQSLTSKQVASLEEAAYQNFISLKAKYKQHTGKDLLPMDSDAQRKMFSRAAGAGG